MARLSKKKVTSALEQEYGIIKYAAKACGVTRDALYKYINKHDMWDVVEACRDILVDDLERKGIDVAMRGHAGQIQFMLKNVGRHRGYADRIEQENTGEQTIKVIYDRSEPIPASSDPEED